MAPKSKKNRGVLKGLLGGNVKGCLEEIMCFEVMFKCGKGFVNHEVYYPGNIRQLVHIHGRYKN